MMISKQPKSLPSSSSSSSAAAVHYRPWLSLPDDLTDQILHRLPLSDYVRFAAVCTHWRSLQTSHRLLHFPRPPPALSLPFLIPFRRDLHPIATCFSPFQQRHYRLHLHHPLAVVLAHNEGWLLLSTDIDELNPWDHMSRLYLLNPVSAVRIPMPGRANVNLRYAISSSPRRDPKHCCVLGVDALQSCCRFVRLGQDSRWTTILLPGILSTADQVLTSPVFSESRGNKFFCVVDGEDSSVGMLSVDVFAAVPRANFTEMSGLRARWGAESTLFSLVECDGELLLVVAERNDVVSADGSRKRQVVVDVNLLRADLEEEEEEWVEVESIGDDRLVIVTEVSTCLVRAAEVGMRGNSILIGSDVRVEGPGPEVWAPWGLFEIDTKTVKRVPAPLDAAGLYDSHVCFVPAIC